MEKHGVLSAGRGLGLYPFLANWLLIAAILVAGAFSPAMGQQTTGGTTGMSPEALRAYGLSGITLTSEQQSRFSALKAEYALKYKAFASQMNTRLKETGERASESDRAQARALRDSHLSEIRGILTPAQQKQFDVNVADMRASSARMRDSLVALRSRTATKAPAPAESKIPILMPDPSRPKEIKTKIKSKQSSQTSSNTSSATQE